MEDRELLKVLRQNPENGIRLVMKQYAALCYYIAKQKLLDFPQEEVEECVSDVFLAFYHQYTAIDLERGSIKGFLSVLARRKAIDRWADWQGRKLCHCRRISRLRILWNSRKNGRFCWMRCWRWEIPMQRL